MENSKTCTKCKIVLDILLFSTNKKSKDGLHSWCRACVNLQRKENKEKYLITQKSYVANNPEKIKQWVENTKKNPEYKIKKANADKIYREKLGDSLRVKKKAYVLNNYTKVQESKKREYEKNKQAYKARAYQRLQNIKRLTPFDADKSKIQQFYIDAKTITLSTGIKHEVDHIIPISKGGLHHQDNLQILTWLENRSKGTKIIDMRSKGGN